MALRNFWVDVDIDGRQSNLSGGPRSKDGGLYITLYQRKEGQKIKAATINCWAEEDGTLRTAIVNIPGNSASSIITKR